MPAAPMFQPDNRLLGGAINDFSLFGGQTDPDAAIPAATTRPVAAPPVSADDTRALPDPASDGATGAAIVTTLFSNDAAATDHGSAAPPASLAQVAIAPVAPSQGDGVDVSHANGSSTPPELLATPVDGLHGVPAQAAPAVEPGESAIHDASTLLTAQVTSGVVDGTVQATSHLVGGAFDAAATIGTDPLHGIGQLATGLVGTAHAALLDGFTGADPAGGVATLVGLVSTSELFSVGHADAGQGVETGAGSIVDDLIGDTSMAPPVLGATDQHHDPVHDVLHGASHTLDHLGL